MTLFLDLRYALRTLGRNPGFTAAAVLSLALGIGANTAIFSLIHAVMLRWLPVQDPQELVQLRILEDGTPNESLSYPLVKALAERKDLFAGVCGFSGMTFHIGASGATEPRRTMFVTAGYYDTLGLTAELGRLLTPADDQPGGAAVAVISHAYWERGFRRDPAIVGQSLIIEGVPVTVVGVHPPGFTGASVGEATDITLPMAVLPQMVPEGAGRLEAGAQWLRVLARPRRGLPLEQLNAGLRVVWPGLAESAVAPSMSPARRRILLNSAIDALPGATGWSSLRSQFRRPLLVLMAMVSLVLLIACANAANLLLARAAARRKEIAVRRAVGAGRARIIRQLLTESVFLSLLAAALGVFLALMGSRSLVDLLSRGRGQPILLDLSLNWTVAGFTAVVAVATAILFGLAPAFRATSAGPAGALRTETRTTTGSRSRLASSLVVGQVALSLLLLVGAGLFVRTLQNLTSVDPGFRHEGVLAVSVNARRLGYRDARLTALYQDLLDRVARVPGVLSASMAADTPLSGRVWSEVVSVDGQPGSDQDTAHFNSLAPGYFATMRTPLLAGRDFSPQDHDAAPPVAIVNEAFARRYFAGASPLGRRISVHGAATRHMEVVGAVVDTSSRNLREAPPPAVYVPYLQYPPVGGGAALVINAGGSLDRVASQVIRELAPSVPPALLQVRALTEQVERTLAQERILATLAVGFGLLALLLAAIGLFGLLSYLVVQRRREFGVRMALGAEGGWILWLVCRNALRFLAAGIFIGLAAAWAASRLVSAMLFGVAVTDPATIGGAAAVLLTTAMLAALLPAWRASRVNAAAVLKDE